VSHASSIGLELPIQPVALRTPDRRLWGPLGVALTSMVLLMACQAPGMKLTLRPNAKETPVQMDGLSLTLRPVTPQLVQAQSAQAARIPEKDNLEPLLSTKPPAYQIGPQDVLLVTVWDHPEITMPMGPNRTDASSGNLVDEEGQIFFPWVGKLKVAGKTCSEIRDLLTVQMAKVLRNPQVDVKVIAFRSQKLYVGGEVRNPAVYAITDVPFTLAEAVNAAGGLLPTADDTRMILTRGNKSWRLNFHALLASSGRLGQVLLQNGDTLQVPSATDEPVYMLGEVAKPGHVALIHGKLSLARALSESGGLIPTSADATSIYVIRPTAIPNAVDVFHLDARNPATMVLADSFALNPHDIVYVDAGSLVRYDRVMNLLLPTISAAASTTIGGWEAFYISRHY